MATNPIPGNPSPCPITACTHGPGHRFLPKDSELIVEFLDRKIKNEVLPYMEKIKDVSFYAFNPEELTETLPTFDDVWYCFTQRNRTYPNGSRSNRAAGKGHWKATGGDQVVKVEGRTVGFKRALVFYRGKKKTNWIMHEFRTATRSPNPDRRPNQSGGKVKKDMKLNDWVLCRFYERKKGRHLRKFNYIDHDHGVNAVFDDDDDQMSEVDSSDGVTGGCDDVAVDDSMTSAMRMPGGQRMYNVIQIPQVTVTSEGNAANVPVAAMAVGGPYYNNVINVPPMVRAEYNTQVGNKQESIPDESGLYALLQPFPADYIPLPEEEILPAPAMEDFEDAGLGVSEMIGLTGHNAADTSAFEEFFDFESYSNLWDGLI